MLQPFNIFQVSKKCLYFNKINFHAFYTVKEYIIFLLLQGESFARGLKLLSMYTVQQRGFLVRKYWQTGSFKVCQTAFQMEFGERRAPSK